MLDWIKNSYLIFGGFMGVVGLLSGITLAYGWNEAAIDVLDAKIESIEENIETKHHSDIAVLLLKVEQVKEKQGIISDRLDSIGVRKMALNTERSEYKF